MYLADYSFFGNRRWKAIVYRRNIPVNLRYEIGARWRRLLPGKNRWVIAERIIVIILKANATYFKVFIKTPFNNEL